MTTSPKQALVQSNDIKIPATRRLEYCNWVGAAVWYLPLQSRIASDYLRNGYGLNLIGDTPSDRCLIGTMDKNPQTPCK